MSLVVGLGSGVERTVPVIVSGSIPRCDMPGSPSVLNVYMLDVPLGGGSAFASPAAVSASTQAYGSRSPVAGGCGGTQVFAGPGPDADLGLADNPWAPATPADAGIVAYFWYPPPDLLFAHGPNDLPKVLWVSHGEQAAHLTIAAHPFNASSPVIRFDFPPASSPVGNYPSAIDLPGAGCWRLEITLGTAHATIDVMVAPAR